MSWTVFAIITDKSKLGNNKSLSPKYKISEPVYCDIFKMYLTVFVRCLLNPLSVNPTKWSNTLKQLVGKLSTNCLSVFDHFLKLALKGLRVYTYATLKSTGIFCLLFLPLAKKVNLEGTNSMEKPYFSN